MRHLCFVALCALSACSHENEIVADDWQDPELELLDPAAAAWMADGKVTVHGRAERLQQLTVNGEAAPLDGDRFEAEIALERGVNLVEARGVDARGDEHFVRHGVLAGSFADPGQLMEDAVKLRVNQGGIDVALDTVGGMIAADEIEATAMSANPVYEDAYGVWGWDAVTIRADITELSFATPQLAARPSNGILTLDADIPDLLVGIRASGDVVGIDFGVDVWLWASKAEITGVMTLDALGGQLVADLRDAGVNLVGFGYDTSLLPGDVEQYLLVDTIRGFVEGMLVDEIETRVPPLLQEQLRSLDLSFETELLGRPVEIDAAIAEAGIDPDGITVDVDMDVYVPSQGDKTYAGYLAADTAGRPEADRHSDVALSLSDDLLNRVLFEAWRSGILAMELSTEDGSLEPLMLAPLHATEGSIAIDAQLPPVVVQKDGRLQAQLGELDVTIRTPGGEMGDFLKASVAAFVDLEIAVEGGELTLDLGKPELSVTVRESDWGASNEATTQLLEEMLPIDTFMLLLGDFSFPLPTLGEVAIDEATVSRDSSGVYTGVGVELD